MIRMPTSTFREEIRKFYKMYRPSPLVRAYCLEEKLQTPAKIYYKFEGKQHQRQPQAHLLSPRPTMQSSRD